MTDPKFRSRREAEQAGWFSRRHETTEAHVTAVTRYRATRGKKARQMRAAIREAEAASHTYGVPE